MGYFERNQWLWGTWMGGRYNDVRAVYDLGGTASSWRLRTPCNHSDHAAKVVFAGAIDLGGQSVEWLTNRIGICPALWHIYNHINWRGSIILLFRGQQG